MSIIYSYDECPSFMNMVNVHHLRCMHVVYYGCQSYMMDVHHIWGITVINDVCPSYIWAYFMMEPKESFSRRNKCKKYDWLCSNGGTDGIGSKRMYGIFGTDETNGAGEKGINWFGDWRLMKLMEPMKIVGWVKFFHWWNWISETK